MRGKVIVVEDNSAFSYAVGKTLEQAGYEVEIHADPTAAWTAVGAAAHFDLLLTDLMFPQGQPSGIALARSARYHNPRVGDNLHDRLPRCGGPGRDGGRDRAQEAN